MQRGFYFALKNVTEGLRVYFRKYAGEVWKSQLFQNDVLYSAAGQIRKQLRHFSAVFQIFGGGNTVEIAAESNAVLPARIYNMGNMGVHAAINIFIPYEIGAEIDPHHSAAVGDFFYLRVG